MNKMTKKIYREFTNRFNNEPILIKSPGRINLIGEHTDYNKGFVLPAAIDKSIIFAFAVNDLNLCRCYSVDMNESCHFELQENLQKSGVQWADFIIGAVDQLQKSGVDAGGFDCVFGGDIPIGAGLSSSAALEGGVIFGLSQLFDYKISKLEMAKMGQKVENNFIGMQCGIMDQFANMYGQEGYALRLDCRSHEFELYPFQRADVSVILCDTGVHRELTSSEYNIRRRQCEEGVKTLQHHHSAVKSLRDVDSSMLNKYMDDFTPTVYQRCKFVIEENERVLAACQALENNDFEEFGRQMYGSHYGLKNLYEVSCEELDVLVEIAENLEGVFGARMMGGGFGGCTINLVRKTSSEKFMNEISKLYKQKIGDEIEIYQVSISDGTKEISTESQS